MLWDDLSRMSNNLMPASGRSLIASPFLKDPYFLRSVVYLCKHTSEGTFGFILNKLYETSLNELIPDTFDKKIEVFLGGPVQPDTIHFLHQYPALIEGGEEIQPGVVWGGNFEQLIALINTDQIDLRYIKFFLGYSGWDSGQLKGELSQDSWFVSESQKQFLFDKKLRSKLWAAWLKEMGNGYEMMINFPLDPSLN